MTTTDPGVARALAQVRSTANALLRAVDDAEAALAEGDSEALNATMAAARETLAPVARLAAEPTATADTMTVGGWVREPGHQRWFQVEHVGRCNEQCRSIVLKGREPLHVAPGDTLPFLTAEQFDADCEREQREAEAERRDLLSQRALDFDHDGDAA